MEINRLLVIDGHSILHRAFYGMPDLTAADGRHTGAVYGFLNILLKTLEEVQPDALAVAFDVHEPTFRHRLYEAYKGTRKPMPEELREQVPLMKEVLRAMEIAVLELPGYEADDILGTLARRGEAAGMEVTILSGDRDLLQIASEKTTIRIPKTAKGQTSIFNYKAADVEREYQVSPAAFIDVKALMGDSSDNVPGVPKVGEKTATELIVAYGSVEGVYEHIEEIKKPALKKNLAENRALAELSRTLVTIDTAAPVEADWESLAMGDLFTPAAYTLFQELGFRNFLNRFSQTPAPAAARESLPYEVVLDKRALEELGDTLKAADRLCVLVLPPTADGGLFSESPGVAVAMEEKHEKRFYFIQSGETLHNGVTGKGIRDLLACLRAHAAEAGEDSLVVWDWKNALSLWGIREEEFDAGIRLEGVLDAAIAAYLLDPLKSDHRPEDVARRYAEHSCEGLEEVLGKRSIAEALKEEADRVEECACRLAEGLLAAGPALTAALKENGLWELYTGIERPISYILYDMERLGIRAEADALAAYGHRLAGRIEELEKTIYEEAGEEFNIASPKQLGQILFEKMGLPYGKKTKSGYSTAADVLEKLSPDYPLVANILEYRGLTKLKSTYADALSGYIAEDGRIHARFHQTVTATGRLSSSDPNLQNIPMRTELGKQIRKCFLPREGWSFTDADYSQIELRLLAHMSGDEGLIAAYREDEDIHRITASKVFHTPLEEVTPAQRSNAKAVNFGIVYGISSFGLSQNLSISRAEAADYIKAYFLTYPGVKAYLDGLVESAKRDGYVRTLYGRKRPVPELKNSNFMQRQFGERVAMNAPIQGTAADIMKLAMIRVWEALRKENLQSRMILQIHDELLIETAPGEEEAVARLLEREMKGAAELLVTLEVSVEQGSDWYGTK